MLLIDEIDRADDEFEAFLLEILSDFAVTVPELGTFVAKVPPVVILTSNRTRDLHDALKRRCLYHWVDHPGIDREVASFGCACPRQANGWHGGSRPPSRRCGDSTSISPREWPKRSIGPEHWLNWASRTGPQ